MRRYLAFFIIFVYHSYIVIRLTSNLQGRRIVHGLCGSIAAGVKGPNISRLLTKQGAEVHAVFSPGAATFVTPTTFQGILAGRTPYYEMTQSLPLYGGEPHVWLGENADILLIAPLSSNTLSQLATGSIGKNCVALTYQSTKPGTPVFVAPAMASAMWQHKTVQEHVHQLQERGVYVIGPEEGELASGAVGIGRMTEPETIVEVLRWEIGRESGKLRDKHIVITAGPTWEAIDVVRGITNQSSGNMAYALARAARDEGANVSLVSTVCDKQEAPVGVVIYPVESAAQMLEKTLALSTSAFAFIGAAAVSDFTVVPTAEKLDRRNTETLDLTLSKTTDILGQVPCENKFGFAADLPEVLHQKAKDKLNEKSLKGIFANSLEDAVGSTTNAGTIYFEKLAEPVSLPTMSKEALAKRLIAEWLFPLL